MALGVTWFPESDVLTLSLIISGASTRRQVAAAVARILDPFGLARPWSIKLRIFLQSLWTSCADWNERMSPSLKNEYNLLLEDSIGHIVTVPRCF